MIATTQRCRVSIDPAASHRARPTPRIWTRGPLKRSPGSKVGPPVSSGWLRIHGTSSFQRRHFNSTAKRFGFGETAEPLIHELVERTPGVIGEVRRELPPGFSDEVAVKVLSGLRTAARVLEVMPAC
jgi:hypothetical protein